MLQVGFMVSASWIRRGMSQESCSRGGEAECVTKGRYGEGYEMVHSSTRECCGK